RLGWLSSEETPCTTRGEEIKGSSIGSRIPRYLRSVPYKNGRRRMTNWILEMGTDRLGLSLLNA
ncbi:MAG: hypothetical protein OXE56_05670, partial [Gammaproteobacteria bacterium]|nr:hypothetical protein [Gammaproteobacteria bacterium]